MAECSTGKWFVERMNICIHLCYWSFFWSMCGKLKYLAKIKFGSVCLLWAYPILFVMSLISNSVCYELNIQLSLLWAHPTQFVMSSSNSVCYELIQLRLWANSAPFVMSLIPSSVSDGSISLSVGLQYTPRLTVRLFYVSSLARRKSQFSPFCTSETTRSLL